jgi:hypothetical protein
MLGNINTARKYMKTRRVNSFLFFFLSCSGSAKKISEEKLEGCAAVASRLAAELYGLQILEEGIEDDKNNFTRFLVLSKFPSVPNASGKWEWPVYFRESFKKKTGKQGIRESGNQGIREARKQGSREARKQGSMEDEPRGAMKFYFPFLPFFSHVLFLVPCKTSIVFSLLDEAGILFKALSVFVLRDIDFTKIESRPGRKHLLSHPLPQDDEALQNSLVVSLNRELRYKKKESKFPIFFTLLLNGFLLFSEIWERISKTP